MITLSEVSSETKAILKWGAIILGSIFLIWVLFQIGILFKNTFYPTPPAPPTVAFGKLPQINLPSQTETVDLDYTLDTLTGNFPSFPDRIKVFKMEEPKANLLALNSVQQKMEENNFSSKPVSVSGNDYKWTDNSPIARTISYDIFSSDFTLTSFYLQDPNIISGKNLPDVSGSIDAAKEFLTSFNIFPSDLDLSKTKTNLFSIKNFTIVSASSISNSQLVQVFFMQKDIEKTPIYYSIPNQSTMSLTIAGGESLPQVIEAKFSHQSVSDNSATYPIKTAEEALEDLKKGNGYIASYQGTKKEVSIQNISLGYYKEDQRQQYLMPVVVFQGNDGFLAYVSAVTDEWIGK